MFSANFMGKRKHGTFTVPMTISTKHFELLKTMKNRSEYIDQAIEYYDGTVNWRLRGKDEDDVHFEEFRAAKASIQRYLERIDSSWGKWIVAEHRKLGIEADKIHATRSRKVNGPRLCGICREPGHNRRNCPKFMVHRASRKDIRGGE
jgi:hypothetical protein